MDGLVFLDDSAVGDDVTVQGGGNNAVLDVASVSEGAVEITTTDAAGLVRGGLKATSIEGIDYSHYLSYYHTDRDDINMINKERRPKDDHGTCWSDRNVRVAMENAVKTMLLYLKKKDQE